MNEITFDTISQISSLPHLLMECGAKDITDKGDYYSFSSPFREDKNPSGAVYKDTLVTVDFGGEFRGSFSYFFFKCTGKSLFSYLELSKDYLLSSSYFDKREHIREFSDKSTIELRIIGGEIQRDFSKNMEAMSYARRRFLTEEFREAFQIGYCTNLRMMRSPFEAFANPSIKMTPFINRVCIPIYENYKLVSMEGRDFTGRGKPKVLYPKGGSVSHLFNHEFLNKKEDLIVVEGIMDMPRIWQHITKNVTTTFGVNVSSHQKEQLLEFDRVILLSDTDDAGYNMIRTFDDFMDKPYWVARLGEGDAGDPENSLDDIERAIEYSKESTEFFLEASGLFEEKTYNHNYFS